jgi:polyhydroxybutyrate depolymerase
VIDAPRLVAAAVLLIAAGCSSAPPAPSQPPRSSGCGRPPPLARGSSEDLTIASDPGQSLGHATRGYRLHLPKGFRPGQPASLLLMFHGRGGTGAEIEGASPFSRLADRRGFVVAYPQGLEAPDGSGSFWSTRGASGVDDVAFVRSLLVHLERQLCLDTRRLYAAGFSNGGGFVITLACRLADRVAAVVSIAGYFFQPSGGCHPVRAISMLEVHGAADDNVVYGGLPAAEGQPALTPVPVWLSEWARLDGCRPAPAVFQRSPQVMAERWSGCRQAAVILHYRLEQFGHAIPAVVAGRPFGELAWEFLEAHGRP